MSVVVSGLAAAACQRVPLLAPSGSTITLTAVATAVPLNGTTDILVQVIEPAGTPPHSGTQILLVTSLGRIEPSEAETDINGRVTVKFIAGGASGTATITAASGGANVGASGVLKIAVGAAAVGSVVIGANPTTVASSGGSSTITASVFDASGNTLASIPVTFTTDAGTLSATLVLTDANGQAQATLTTGRTAKVTATAGIASASGTTTTAAPTASVTVNVNIPQSITIGTPSPESPTVGQTVSLPLTYVTTSGATPVAQVTVNWGDGAVDALSGQPGAVSHSYSEARSYIVQVIGTDASGDTSRTSRSITVGPRPTPSVGLTVSNDNPTVNNAVTFTVTVSVVPAASGVTIRNTHLDYGDGSSVDLGPTGTTATHVYTSVGTKTAKATATDTNGSTATAQVTVNVKP